MIDQEALVLIEGQGRAVMGYFLGFEEIKGVKYVKLRLREGLYKGCVQYTPLEGAAITISDELTMDQVVDKLAAARHRGSLGIN